MSVATIAPELLYWDLLPAAMRRAARSTQDYQFEQVLPLSVEALQTARAALPDGRTLVVGIEPDRLRAQLLALGTQPWRLTPAASPAHLAGVPLATLDRLDLLHGAFEPASRRRLRLAGTAMVAAAALIAAVCIGVGALRRAAALERLALRIESEASAAAAQLVPGDVALPPALRLSDELARLESLRGEQSDAKRWSDAVPLLADLWARWPRDLRTRVEAVTVSHERIVVRAALAAAADGERLAAALGAKPLGGRRWRSEQLQVATQGDVAQAVLTLVPTLTGTSP